MTSRPPKKKLRPAEVGILVAFCGLIASFLLPWLAIVPMIIANFFGTRRDSNDLVLYVALFAQWAIIGVVVARLMASKQRKAADSNGDF
jgi:hypothetical protein